MDLLEGGEGPPRQPFFAYTESADCDDADHREGERRLDSDDGDSVQAVLPADLLTLQRQLDEREIENERVRRDALELRNQLIAAKAEAAALKEAVREKAVPEEAGAPTREPVSVTQAPPADAESASRIVSDAFAELAKVRSESFKARKELERERMYHRAEMQRARGQYHSAQDELQRLIKVRRAMPAHPAPSRPVVAAVPPVPATEERGGGRLPAAVAVVAAVLLAVLLWPRISRWSAQRVTPSDVRQPAQYERPQTEALPLTPAARAQFQGAVGRLSRVLAGRPGRAPEELLRQAHEMYKATDPTLCAFDWRNGQPSLLYGGGHISLGQTIQRCADAIEKIP